MQDNDFQFTLIIHIDIYNIYIETVIGAYKTIITFNNC